MERNNPLYKIRRSGQRLAHIIFPDDFLSKVYFRLVMREHLNLTDPKTFNEKIQWCKLNAFPFDPLVVQCADKYAVRRHVAEKGLENKLVPLIGVWESPSEIDWKTLPEQFVLKCNHGCAYNIVCADKSLCDEAATKKQLATWLKEDFGAFNIELHYSKITPKLITCEEFLGSALVDFKFFCFNGVPKYLYVSRDLVHDRQAQIGFFYADGTPLDIKRDDYAELENTAMPPFFDEMFKAACVLSEDFPFVRVDFFVTDETFYFAELTFTPSAGMMPFNPKQYDLTWGEELDISKYMDAAHE